MFSKIENNIAKLIFFSGTGVVYFFSAENNDLSFVGILIYILLTTIVSSFIDSDFSEAVDFSLIAKLIFSIIFFIIYFGTIYYLADIVGSIFGIIGLSLMR